MVYDCASSIYSSLRQLLCKFRLLAASETQRPPVSALIPHEGRRYQGIASKTLSSKADQ